jgi:hypothetical protein
LDIAGSKKAYGLTEKRLERNTEYSVTVYLEFKLISLLLDEKDIGRVMLGNMWIHGECPAVVNRDTCLSLADSKATIARDKEAEKVASSAESVGEFAIREVAERMV